MVTPRVSIVCPSRHNGSEINGYPVVNIVRATTSNGNYTVSITPDQTGTWKVNGAWIGDDTHMGSSSTEETFNVEEKKIMPEPEPEKPLIPGFSYESIFIGLVLVNARASISSNERFGAMILSPPHTQKKCKSLA